MISAMRGAAADIFLHLLVQIPYSYSHVMALVVKFHLFMVRTKGGRGRRQKVG